MSLGLEDVTDNWTPVTDKHNWWRPSKTNDKSRYQKKFLSLAYQKIISETRNLWVRSSINYYYYSSDYKDESTYVYRTGFYKNQSKNETSSRELKSNGNTVPYSSSHFHSNWIKQFKFESYKKLNSYNDMMQQLTMRNSACKIKFFVYGMYDLISGTKDGNENNLEFNELDKEKQLKDLNGFCYLR